MPILFDTGACELLRRRDRRAEKLAIDFFPPQLCTHVVGEFLYGQVMAGVGPGALLEAREFLESFDVHVPGVATAAIYARIRAELKQDGIVLPDPDYWIAAHAIQQNIPMASTDRDFERLNEVPLFYLVRPR